jgi:hypothetical protein
MRNRRNRGLRLSPVGAWLLALHAKDLQPKIVVIDNDAKWDISEAVWIDRLRREGAKLLNVASLVD